jgi:hypothetical protein
VFELDPSFDHTLGFLGSLAGARVAVTVVRGSKRIYMFSRMHCDVVSFLS